MPESFLRRFVSRLSTPAAVQIPQVFLGAFGKHPAWDDHMPDHLGLETNALIELKQTLYGGIRGNVESGAWDKLKESHQLTPFSHAFIWRTPSVGIAGRLWQSSDGKGRDAYPMVVAAECSGIDALGVAEECFSECRDLQSQLIALHSPADVQAAIDKSRTQLRQRILTGDSAPHADAAPVDARVVLNSVPELGPGPEGVLRILYHIEREMGAYRDGKTSSGAKGISNRPQAIRVPRGGVSQAQSAGLWIRFLLSQLSPSVSCLALLPDNDDWIDLIVGIPAPAQIFCIRAPLAVLPLTNSIPYTIDADFARQAGLSDA